VTQQETATLFDYLCRHKPLAQWLVEQRDTQIKILVSNNDINMIKQAQGQARFIELMLDKLNAAEQAAKKR
jgi:hypothetical protein